MRVRTIITVEVDPETWATEYGTELTPTEVREDVKAYIFGVVNGSYAADLELFKVANA